MLIIKRYPRDGLTPSCIYKQLYQKYKSSFLDVVNMVTIKDIIKQCHEVSTSKFKLNTKDKVKCLKNILIWKKYESDESLIQK